jgi:hypothetical protein
MKAAAEKSLAHLPSVQMLQAAVAQGANHVTELGPQDYQALQQARLLMLLRVSPATHTALPWLLHCLSSSWRLQEED